MRATLVCLSVFVAAAFAAPNVPGGRILGGGPAATGQIPYQTSIQYCIQSGCQHACGGAIIGSLWVMSSASCITQAPALGSYQIIAGIKDLNDEDPERQVIRVSFVIIHPDHTTNINPYDIAIFRLATPLTFNNKVQAINLPPADAEFEEVSVVSGWGSVTGTQVPNMPTALQYVEAPLIPVETCKSALDSVVGGGAHPFDVEYNICTGPLTGGTSICTGDPGGPVADLQGQTLIGIASWFVTPCGTVGAPSVHIRLSKFTNWIRASISV